MAGAAAAAVASGTGRCACRAHPGACGSLVSSAALKAANRHYFLNFARIAFRAVYFLIFSKNQMLEFFTAFTAFVLENRHVFLRLFLLLLFIKTFQHCGHKEREHDFVVTDKGHTGSPGSHRGALDYVYLAPVVALEVHI